MPAVDLSSFLRSVARGARSRSPLEELCARRQRDGFLARAARLYGFGIALSYGVVLAFDSRAADALIARALATLAWIVGGILALTAARDPEGDAGADGLQALSAQRGFPENELSAARLLLAVRSLVKATALPALLLSLVPFFHARAAADVASSVARSLAALIFCAVLGVSLGVLARAASHAAPGRGRLLLFSIVVLPHAARSVWPDFPSVPALFQALLGALFGASGA